MNFLFVCCFFVLGSAMASYPWPQSRRPIEPSEDRGRDGINAVPLSYYADDLTPVPLKDALQEDPAPIPLTVDEFQAEIVKSRALPLPSPSARLTLNPNRYYWTSPRFPLRYPNNLLIEGTLRGSSGQTITIRCPIFDVEYHPTCSWDWLSINGRKYCGRRRISTISGTELAIQFRTDYSVRRCGFYCLIDVPEAEETTTTAPTTTTTESTTTTTEPTTTTTEPTTTTTEPTTTTTAPMTTTSSPSALCCGEVNRSSRIVGGVQTEINEYPWQAGLVSPGSTRTFCGGSIINNRYVLTAAHCTENFASPSQIQVMLGDHNIGGTADPFEERYLVEQIIQHPNYNGNVANGFDYSLLRLDRDIIFNGGVGPVCLPEGDDSFAGVTATATGFGRFDNSLNTQSTYLREVDLEVWDQDRCRTVWTFVTDTILCAGGLPEGGKSVCNGDSGGPLVTLIDGRYTLIGATSFGRPCAIPNFPDGFARITEELPWIQASMENYSLC